MRIDSDSGSDVSPSTMYGYGLHQGDVGAQVGFQAHYIGSDIEDHMVEPLASCPARGIEMTFRKRKLARSSQGSRMAWRPKQNQVKSVQVPAYESVRELGIQVCMEETTCHLDEVSNSLGDGGLCMCHANGLEWHGWVDELELPCRRGCGSDHSSLANKTDSSSTDAAAQTGTDYGGLGYGDAAVVTREVAVCGCRHSLLDNTSFTVLRAQHDLLQLCVGEVGLVKEVYAEKAMIKVMFPEVGTAFISWLEADSCFKFLVPMP